MRRKRPSQGEKTTLPGEESITAFKKGDIGVDDKGLESIFKEGGEDLERRGPETVDYRKSPQLHIYRGKVPGEKSCGFKEKGRRREPQASQEHKKWPEKLQREAQQQKKTNLKSTNGCHKSEKERGQM